MRGDALIEPHPAKSRKRASEASGGAKSAGRNTNNALQEWFCEHWEEWFT